MAVLVDSGRADKGRSAMVTTTLGRQIGNYRLLRLLGQGGFADVYLGEHLYLKTHAAIKVLHTHLASRDVHRFIAEAQTIARLNHSHIVRVFDFGLDGTMPYLIMDYASNGTLRQRHPRGSIVPITLVISYAKQVAAALQYAHDTKLIHRDVKPENILLGRNNEVILSDFGIAVTAHSTSSLKTLDRSGTPYYMAPEHIQGKPRPASDQYALGVVVYEWLCGGRPFDGDLMNVLYEQIHVPPPSLRGQAPTISPAIEQVVLRALAKDPQQRYASVEAFVIALEEASQQFGRERALCIYSGHNPLVLAMEWSLDAIRIASTDFGANLRIWDARTGETLTLNKSLSPMAGRAIAWSPVGKYLAVGDNSQSIQVWNSTTGDCRFHDHTQGFVDVVAWSPDGRHLAVGSFVKINSKDQEYVVQVWDMQTGDNCFNEYLQIPQKGIGLFAMLGRTGMVSIRWLSDCKRIAFVRLDKVVEIWDVTTKKKLSSYNYNGPTDDVYQVVLSPNVRFVANIKSDPTVEVWNLTTGDLICTYRGHAGQVNCVVWSPDSMHIASSGNDRTVQIWDAATGKHRFTYWGHSGSVDVIAWSPEGKRIVSASSDRIVHVWQAA